MPKLTPLELATDSVFGIDSGNASLPEPVPGRSALAALEDAILPAVARPPCIVTFSGGRDSSLVLAVAARVARREGLPLPIPATVRFLDMQGSEESSWQELVLEHLNLVERITIEVRTDFDLVGPLAGKLLRRHGILWPLNVYLQASLLPPAREGSLLTGLMGDALFGGGRWFAVNEVLGGRRKPVARDFLRLGLALAPRWLRARVMERRVEAFPWLRAGARKAFIALKSQAEASAPWRWDRWIEHLSHRRAWRIAKESMDQVAAAENALHLEPLADRSFLASLARTGGRYGIGDRTGIMRALFSDVLPDQVLSRSDKAVFGSAFVGPETKEFAWAWKGGGIDSTIVDPDALRAAWLGERFNTRAALLLQAAWLHEQEPARPSF